jgi:hypothetical protein
MIATKKMIFAISMEIMAIPPKPRTPATNAMIRKVRAQPNMKKALRIDCGRGITSIAYLGH